MEALLVSDILEVQSHKGPYQVFFDKNFFENVSIITDGEPHFIVDANIANLYKNELKSIIEHPNAIVVEATEKNKSLEKVIPVINQLVANKIRRTHVLVAIGGGIIQDITCFIASTLLRGLRWKLVPTTLLAQADSCIGSKSSINLGDAKNILGTFNPPSEIYVNSTFLNTLEDKEIQSGVGEIIKVHIIDGMESFDQLAVEFPKLFTDAEVLSKYIRSALIIKQGYIEKDEFDKGIRNIFNYGHSFGHAIESATHYEIPHGIAVTIGMDMANYIAVARGLLPEVHYHRMHLVLLSNYKNYLGTQIPIDTMLAALMKDKKNTSTTLGLIFPVGDKADVQLLHLPSDDEFRSQCVEFFNGFNA